MTYGQRGGNAPRSKGTAARLTGLFKSKRPGLFVGSLRAQDMEGLITKLKEAKAVSRGLTFFVWKNDRDNGPALSLSVDVEREREAPRSQGGSRRIQEDDDIFGSGGGKDTGDDSLFGKD